MGKRKRRTGRKSKDSLILRLITAIGKRINDLQKKRKRRNKLKPKNEFRFNYKTGHTNFIFGEIGNKYKSVGLTSHDTTFGRKNMPLKSNPKIGDVDKQRASYIRNGIISEKKESFSKREAKNFAFSQEDKANVKSKIRHYKKEQKYRK